MLGPLGSQLQGLGGAVRARRAASPLGRLTALQAALQAQAGGDPLQSIGYLAETGALRDGLRADADADAGRAGALGLTPGMALASGAGNRSRALVAGLRSAAAGAGQRQDVLRAQSTSLLGTLAGIDEQKREAERARKEERRAALINAIGSLGGSLVTAGLSFVGGARPPRNFGQG